MTTVVDKPGESSRSALVLPDPETQATIFARIQPAAFLSRFYEKRIRPDGRSFSESRKVSIARSIVKSSADGSAIVRLGDTIVIAGIKAEVLDTSDEVHDMDDNGNDDDVDSDIVNPTASLGPIERRRVVIGVDLVPMASPKFKTGPPGEEAQVLSSRLMQSLDSCPPVDIASLRIQNSSEHSWCLYVDVMCIAYDGNVVDASMLAINAALRDCQLPEARIDANSQAVLCSASTQVPLHIVASPLSFTYSIIRDELVSDVNAFEQSHVRSTITLIVNASEESVEITQTFISGNCCAWVEEPEAIKCKAISEDERRHNHQKKQYGSVTLVWMQDEELLRICMARTKKRLADLTATLA